MDKQSHLYIDFHRGLINVLKRIQKKYPDLVMQACASGGGRANYGLLPYFDEFWVSDNTDALQRIYMQWGYPIFSLLLQWHLMLVQGAIIKLEGLLH